MTPAIPTSEGILAMPRHFGSGSEPAQDLQAVEGRRAGTSKRFVRGYDVPLHARRAVARAKRTSLVRSTGAAVFDLVAIASLAVVATMAWQTQPPLVAIATSLLTASAMGRFLRGLECLVHEASHDNWDRRRRVNDFLANALAALPVVSRVEPYRARHLVHHRYLGGEDDPDARRYDELGLAHLSRSSGLRLGWRVLRLLPRSLTSWFRAIGVDRRTLLASAGWYAAIAVFVVPLAGVRSFGIGIAHAVAAFLGPLPFVRLVGEAEEHRYTDGQTVVAATVSNLGIVHRVLYHPHGDGYHVEHHLWISVPHHRLRRLHRELVAVDATGYAQELRYRTRVLEAPRQGIQSVLGHA